MRHGTAVKINLTLLRHGATVSNATHRYLGRTEEPLSAEGRRQLEEKLQRGCYSSCDLVFSSPMERCLQTAALLYPGQEPILIPEWTEMDFGRFEGKNYRELSGDREYQAWIDSNGTLPFPGGESREAFTERSLQGFYRVQAILQGQAMLQGQQEIAAVVHGGTIMALLSAWNQGDYYDFQVKNGQGYRCSLLCRGTNCKVLELEKL